MQSDVDRRSQLSSHAYDEDARTQRNDDSILLGENIVIDNDWRIDYVQTFQLEKER